MYLVICRRTGALLGKYKTRNAARRKCDKVDLENGGIVTMIREEI